MLSPSLGSHEYTLPTALSQGVLQHPARLQRRLCPLHPKAIPGALLAGDSGEQPSDTSQISVPGQLGQDTRHRCEFGFVRMLLWHGNASFPCARPVQLYF